MHMLMDGPGLVQEGVGAATTLRVAAKTTVAEDVVTVELVSPSGGRLPDWTPGAHIDLSLPNGSTRQYSLCGDRFDPSRYRVGVLREPAGRGGSAYVHDELAVGDLVGVGGPRNNFPMVPSERYQFIAGGIGITPLMPMIRQADALGADWNLLYGGRRRSSMAFLDELSRYGDRVRVAPQDEVGMLDLPGYLAGPRPGVTTYACGPAPLLDAVQSISAPWPAHALRLERFVRQEPTAPVRRSPFEVVLARAGVTLTVPPEKSVLAAVHEVGVEVLSSCRQGVCGTCEVGVLDGEPDHRDSLLEDHERRAGGSMFICVSRARSDRLVLDL